MESSDLWEKVLIPIIVGPIFLTIKILYDKWDYKKKETMILKNKLRLEKLNDKLKNFYWPIYILLLKDFDLWSKIIFKDIPNIDITESDSDSDSENEMNDNFKFCIHMRNINNKLVKCKNPVAINCISKYGSYCLKHQCFRNKKILESYTIDYSKNTNVDISENRKKIVTYDNDISNNIKDEVVINIPINNTEISNKNNISHIAQYITSHSTLDKINDNDKKQNNESDSSDSISNLIEDINKNYSATTIPGNITGNKVGEITGLNLDSDKTSTLNLKSEMVDQIIKKLGDNHDKISDKIINYISIAEPKSYIGKQLIKYIKFINIFSAEIKTDDLINPSKYGAPYPKKLLPLIEIELFKLQKEYNLAIKNYYHN